MKRRQVAMLLGAIWVLVRFAVVLAIARAALGRGMVANISLLWVGATTIVVAVIFATAVYRPNLHGAYVPLLRISMILMVLSDIVVILTGSYVSRSDVASFDGSRNSPEFTIAFAILVVDLLIAAALVSYRPVETTPAPPSDNHLPPYKTTDLGGE